jgi:hypothetical protein
MKPKRQVARLLATTAIAVAGTALTMAGAGDAQTSPVPGDAHPPPLSGSLAVPSVTLGAGKGGQAGQYTWEISAYGREGRLPLAPHDRQRPCVDVYMRQIDRVGHTVNLHDTAACYGLPSSVPGYLTATREPLIAVGRAPIGRQKPTTLTAVGMIFAPAATTLEATFEDGDTQTLALHQLNPQQARTIDRGPFSYAAFAVEGRWCPVQLVSRNADGEALWEAQEHGCLRGAEQFQGESAALMLPGSGRPKIMSPRR